MAELLVAMAITSIITLVLFSLVTLSTESYSQTQRAVNKLSQARAFLQFFQRELTTRLPGTSILHEKGSGGGVQASDQFAFVRAMSQDEQPLRSQGDLGTSIYYVAFSTDRGNAVSPKLFRKTLDAAQTQNLLQTPGDPAFPAVDPSTDEAMIYNVIDFRALPQFQNPASGEWQDWDANSPERPSRVSLNVRLLDESSAAQFTREEDWNRIATNPRDNERRLIRTFNFMISIAK
jgi:type II secretory pathway pseudopilin PulG